MTIRAVVLDMDGLMLDTEPIYKESWQQAARELGFDLDDRWYSILTGRSNKDCERELVNRFGAEFPMSRFRERWSELWRSFVNARGMPTKPGLSAFLSFVEELALPSAVATSSDSEQTEFSLKSAGLIGRFDAVITGDQIRCGKPAPDIYLKAAEQLGINAAECVALEDSDAGVHAARAAGMQTLCIPDLKPPSEATVQSASAVLGSLTEARDWIGAMTANRRPSN